MQRVTPGGIPGTPHGSAGEQAVVSKDGAVTSRHVDPARELLWAHESADISEAPIDQSVQLNNLRLTCGALSRTSFGSADVRALPRTSRLLARGFISSES